LRIKKLEIAGFKSFCERTVLTFDQPITAVVGPNGCGKSNIVDAIRWCMGEQSAKHLRGRSMEDVIFAGSDGRGPQSMAEVSLTFSNDGRVPIEYFDYPEITVTRRLYRDGDSDYLINKTQCRLRDVHDLFLGTGVGTKAYSIIEQGRIGLIVSSRPEDRRTIIEEAAGITKYKSKKKAADKQIEATRHNLLRVSDVLRELDQRLTTLRKQADKADKYRSYRAELRELELHGAACRLMGLLAEQRYLATAAGDAVTGRGELETALLTQQTELEALRLTAAQAERQVHELQERLYEVDHRRKLDESGITFREREQRELQQRAVDERAELEALRERLTSAHEETHSLRGEVERLDEQWQVAKNGLQDRVEIERSSREAVAEAQAEWESCRTQIAQHEAAMARAEANERNLQRRRDEIELRLVRLREERAEQEGREQEAQRLASTSTERAHESRARLEETIAQHGSRKAELAELDGELVASTKRLEPLRTARQRKHSRRGSLVELLERYEGLDEGARVVLRGAKGAQAPSPSGGHQAPPAHGIRGLVSELIQPSAELELAVEAVLENRLGFVLVDQQKTAAELIASLRAHQGGRASFVPAEELRPCRAGAAAHSAELRDRAGVRGALLDQLQPLRSDGVPHSAVEQKVLTALLGDVWLVDDLATALALWQETSDSHRSAPMFVTVDGDVVDGSGIVTGGPRRSSAAGVLQQQREIRELEEQVATLDRTIASQVAVIEEGQRRRTLLAEELEQLAEQRHQLEVERVAHDKDVARDRAEVERARQRASVLDDEVASLEEQVERATAERLSMARSLVAEEQAQGEAQRRLSGAAERLLTLREAAEELQRSATELKVRTAQLGEQRATARGGLARVEAEIRERAARADRLQVALADGETRQDVLDRALLALRRSVLELADASARVAEELTQARGAYEEQLAALEQLEVELRKRRQALDQATARCGALELQLREVELQQRHVIEQVEDRYRVDLRSVLHDFHLRAASEAEDEVRVAELRRAIERMGEVNLTAVEECAEIEQRFAFLSGQRADLETALAQLDAAIGRIDATSEQRFGTTFERVNQQFQELFPRLFRGGRAELLLTQPNAMLDTGVEIVAQPPGKKNQAVELLSGGEKALTAVALIFAIFLIKPSPFCLLDEVDAPLDEANVGRFNELIRELTDYSQFIVITHNKRTMQIADTLYGVTMEQPGISKLVAVQLSRSETSSRAA
jgi:chromosome segregation protein